MLGGGGKRGDISRCTATLGPMLTGLERVSTWVVGAVIACALSGVSACQPSATGPTTADPTGRKTARSGSRMTEGELPGIDTSQLTGRERGEWWTHVSELLAPCSDQPVSIAQCVQEARPCPACSPAAEFLLRQVTLGKTRAQVEAAFVLRFDPDSIQSIDIGRAPFKGPEKAPVTIVEWADFQCPFCALASPYLDYLVKAYPGFVKVVFRHFPISHHHYAIPAARAAIAAGQQGKFWEMHDLLFANRQEIDDTSFLRFAQELALDTDRFQVDMAAQATLDVIERDRREADKLGLRGTPMIYIDGRNFDLQHFDMMQDMQPWVETEIAITTGQVVSSRLPPPRLDVGQGSSGVTGVAE
jgi:protein-disulfide isomerase